MSGADRPGVTARLFAALAGVADGGPLVQVIDVEQVVVHGHLVLGVVVGTIPGDGPEIAESAFLDRLTRLADEVAEAAEVAGFDDLDE